VNLLRPILLALAGLAALGLIVRQVNQAVKRTFAPPAGLAQVNKATPRTQNGLTLLEIQNVSPDQFYNYTEKGPQGGGSSNSISATPESDTGLWIKLPTAANPPQNCGTSDTVGCDKLLTLTGRTSDGETFPMTWRLSRYTKANEPETCVLLTTIPAGYPNTVQWVDVTCRDAQGDNASWRINHLPPMQQVLGPGTVARATFHQGTIQAVAHAYGGPSINSDSHPPVPVITYDLKGTIKGAAHQWELGPLRQTLEWEPPGFTASDNGSTTGTGKVGSTVNFEMSRQQVYYGRTTPYLGDTHWARLEAQLQEFETRDETVIFHNLSVVKVQGSSYLAGTYPQTVTTPDGVTVTLDDVQHSPHLSSVYIGAGYSLHLLYPQTAKYLTLPRSPLWRKYQRTVKVSADIPKPYESYGAGYSDTEGTYHFKTAHPLPKLIASFPVIIRQRVDLRAVPMTFTLPVQQKRQTPHAP